MSNQLIILPNSLIPFRAAQSGLHLGRLLRQNPVVQNHDDAGVDLHSGTEQFWCMKKISLKANQKRNKRPSRKRGISLYDLSKDLCGSVSGPRDMSTRKLTGYGRD
jgi:hypothetical protein